jgi:hypothetical protein
MFSLPPPRHISTLPKAVRLRMSTSFPVYPQQRTLDGHAGTSEKCHKPTFPI